MAALAAGPLLLLRADRSGCPRSRRGSRAGSRAPIPFEDYYGAPELASDAHRLDVSIPWFSAPGARASLELIARLGAEAIGEHNLALARAFASELGLAEPASPILRVPVEDAESAVERLKRAGVACSARSGSIRFAFHLYNDEEDVGLALEALRPAAAVRSDA